MTTAIAAGAGTPNLHESQSSSRNSRIEIIQCLRGLAAFAVCWFHFTNGNVNFLPDGLLKNSGRYGGLGIEIFFVISGFIVPFSLHAARYPPSLANYGRFLWKRISRLDPPYLASIALVIALSYLSGALPGFRGRPYVFSLGQVALHLGYLNAFFHRPWLNPAYWTLAIEFQYYLLVGLVFPVMVSSRRWVRLAGMGALSLSALVLHPPAFIFPYFFLFIMGFTAFQFRAGIIGRWELFCLLGLALAGCCVTLDTLMATAGVVTVGLILTVVWTNRLLAFLGQVSYSLYLVHVPIGGRIINLGERVGGGLPTKMAFLAMATLGSIAAAYALFRLVEKPCQKYASSLRFSEMAPAPVGQ